MKHLLICLTLASVLFSCKKTKKDQPVISGYSGETSADYGNGFRVLPEQSIIYWTGSSINGSHNGSLKVKSGNMSIDNNGLVQGGDFTVDMNSIADIDIADPKDRADLENHLKSGEFFAVDTFPEATFHIISAASLADSLTNCLIHGSLNLRGVEREIDFKAKVIHAGTTTLINVPEFSIDRTQWGVNYKSSRIADMIKDELISDNIRITIKLLLVK